jgi:hypothetical protein
VALKGVGVRTDRVVVGGRESEGSSTKSSVIFKELCSRLINLLLPETPGNFSWSKFAFRCCTMTQLCLQILKISKVLLNEIPPMHLKTSTFNRFPSHSESEFF